MILCHETGLPEIAGDTINDKRLDVSRMIVEETTVADRPAIVPEIRSSVYITGVHWFVRRSDDPFSEGFLV